MKIRWILAACLGVVAAVLAWVIWDIAPWNWSHEYWDSILGAYGYPVLFVGTCLEGESIMLLAGVAARAGSLELRWVILLGFLGSLLGDQTIFFVSRMWGKAILRRFPRWHPPMGRINRFLQTHGTWYMLSFRFFYGLRNPTPFVVGLSNIKTLRFVTLNVIGAALWATTVGLAGYLFGAVVEQWLSELKWLVLALAVVAITLWVVRHLWRRSKAKKQCPVDASPAEVLGEPAAAAEQRDEGAGTRD